MHLNVLLVDDEYLIRDLIRMRLDWAAYGMDIIAEADCGAQALELVERYLPDIVFTDICMPDMSGIELARHIKEQHQEIKVVIITGYDDFEYARQSLQLGVVDYLLKPIRQQDLTDVADRLAREIEAERQRGRELEGLRVEVEANRPFLRERFLTGWMMEEIDLEELAERLDYFGLPFSVETPLEVALLACWLPGRMTEEHKLLLEAQCVDLARTFFVSETCEVFVDGWKRIVVLVGPDAEQPERYEDLCEYMRQHARCQIVIGVGCMAQSAAQIRHSYSQAANALNYRLVTGDNQVIYYEDVVSVPLKPKTDFRREIERLLFYLSAGVSEQVETVLQDIMAFPGVEGSDALLQARQRAIDIVMGSRELVSSGAQPTAPDDTWAFLFADTLPALLEGLMDYLGQLANRVWSAHRDQTNSLTAQAMAHMEERLADSALRLADVAAVLYISPGHLSRLMKQETGKTFVEYLTHLRMNRAMELLRATELRSYEIAERVGISDPHYFSVLFKKSVGMSVQEYREQKNQHENA